MRVRALALVTTLTVAGLVGIATPPVVAAERGPGPGLGIVTAESLYGNGTVRGPVRRTAQGRLEVRLPGGSWIECAYSCADTLRRETVDFWRNHGGGGPRAGGSDGPGYFRFKF
jgi:hypothetical protein